MKTRKTFTTISRPIPVDMIGRIHADMFFQSRYLLNEVNVKIKLTNNITAITFHQSCIYPRNPLEGCYQFCCLVKRGTMGVNSLPKTVTQQRRGCDLNPGPSAPESSTLTTRLPSHPTCSYRRKITKLCAIVSVLFFSRPRSEGWLHHGRTFSIYSCPL